MRRNRRCREGHKKTKRNESNGLCESCQSGRGKHAAKFRRATAQPLYAEVHKSERPGGVQYRQVDLFFKRPDAPKLITTLDDVKKYGDRCRESAEYLCDQADISARIGKARFVEDNLQGPIKVSVSSGSPKGNSRLKKLEEQLHEEYFWDVKE